MALGDIKFVRIPLTLDIGSVADTVIQDGVTALFPEAVWDIVGVEIVNVTGRNRVSKSVLVVAGRQKT